MNQKANVGIGSRKAGEISFTVRGEKVKIGCGEIMFAGTWYMCTCVYCT